MNNRDWTDRNLEIPREEWGKVEAVPTNASSSYYNSEHYYNGIEQEAIIEGKYQEGIHYATPGADIIEERGKVESNPYNTDNSRGWTDGDVSKPREEWGEVEAEPHNIDNSRGWTDWDLSRPREEWGSLETGGPNINGKTPGELIAAGLLTAENLGPEEKQVIYQDIMMGLTNNKDLLSKKIDLIISDKEMVNNIVSNQYMLAVQEMKKEEKGFVDHSPTNRKFQFLTTVKMLVEKGYDINSLTFNKGENKIGLAKLMSDFRKECSEHRAKNIEDPSWFKNGKAPDGYDTRKVNNPWLFSGVLITDIYINNPQLFEAEYENYKATTKMPPEQRLDYESYIRYAYGIEVPVKTDNLTQFKEARARQIARDQIVREQQLAGLTQEMVETKEGHNLK